MENNDFGKFLKEMNNENLYSLLRIDKEANPLEIRASFKKVIKECHPDKVPLHLKDQAAIRFQKIQKVYNFLKNHTNRTHYNNHLGHLEERKNKTNKMNSERKKFQDELIKRENEGKEFNDSNSKTTERKKSKEKNKKEETIDESNLNNHEYVNQSHKDIQYIKIKRKNEKLKESGIRIKWRKDSTFSYNKEIIYEFFIEYGPISEINLHLDKREAYILFQTNNSILKLFEKQDKNLFAMFRMERYKFDEKNDEIEDIHHLRTSLLDSNIINMIKNKKIKENSEFLQTKRVFSDVPLEKLKFTEEFKINEIISNKAKYNIGIETKQLTLEELEKIVSEKILN